MTKDSTKKSTVLLLFLSWLVYTAANVGRMDYSASMQAVIEETGADKDAAGLVASFFFFSYGIGQLISGLLCKKFNVRLVVFGALIISAATNVLMPIIGDVRYMIYPWCANGLAQSVLWCSLVRLQSEYLSDKNIEKSILLMSTTTAAGTFLSYGISALNVAVASWQLTFYAAGAIIAVSAVLWLFGIGFVQKNLSRIETVQVVAVAERKYSGRSHIPALIFVAIFAVACGFVRDGVTSWMPTLLKDTYSLPTFAAILLTLILPLISITGAYLSKFLHKSISNYIFLTGIFFVVSCGIFSVLFGIYDKTLVVTVIMFALVACLMAAINNIVDSSVPFKFRTIGNSGFYAGLIDTFCYVGSTVSTYLLGWVSKGYGWGNVILLLIAVSAVIGIIACGYSVSWKKRISPLINEI